MSSVDPRKGLSVVAEQLAEVDQRRAELVAERDILMVAARYRRDMGRIHRRRPIRTRHTLGV